MDMMKVVSVVSTVFWAHIQRFVTEARAHSLEYQAGFDLNSKFL